jgi:hypothetical protein
VSRARHDAESCETSRSREEWEEKSKNSLPVDVHTLDCETRDVVDGDVLEFGVLRPVLVEDEEKLLSATEGEDGEKDTTSTLNNRLDQVCEGGV